MLVGPRQPGALVRLADGRPGGPLPAAPAGAEQALAGRGEREGPPVDAAVVGDERSVGSGRDDDRPAADAVLDDASALDDGERYAIAAPSTDTPTTIVRPASRSSVPSQPISWVSSSYPYFGSK